MKKDSLVYVNTEIKSPEEDIIGFSAQVDSIADAIENGASMVGVIADYGSGKSSIGELLEAKKQFKKPIRVNMWDSLKSVKPDNLDQEDLIALDKSFLYQIAYNSGNKGLARHVNKRMNKSNGFISFTLKSGKFIFWFILATIFIVAGILIHASNFSFPIKDYTIGNEIYWIFYLFAVITIIIGLRNGSIAFSSWKSEGDKKFDSSDVFSIYSEIVDCIKPLRSKNKKRIIIIEDLDRLGKNDIGLITNFIKEVYRFSNLSKDYGISFIISIKPAAQLYSEKAENEFSLDYDKVFDYIIDLRPIHIDDFSTILNGLLEEKKDVLSQWLSINDEEELFSEFSILIGGCNLNIRKLKHRLNTALTLYKSLKEKHGGEDSNIDIKTCCVVAYLQSQYEKDYFRLISEEVLFNSIVKKAYSLRLLAEKTPENQIKELKDFILEHGQEENENVLDFDENFCDELSLFLINGLITSDFRQYFYSYPKDSYIKTIEESELENLILFPNKEVDFEYLNILVEDSIRRGGKVIKSSIQMLKDRKILLPTIILKNEKLLDYCYTKFPDDVIAMMQKNLLWDADNSNRTIDLFSLIDTYKFNAKCNLYEDYAVAIASSIGAMGAKASNCRLGLTKALGHNIIYFSSIFHATGSPCISVDELEFIEKEDDVFALLDEKKVNAQLIVALNEKFNSPVSVTNYDKLSKTLLNSVATLPEDKNIAERIINILYTNGKVDNKLFDYAVDAAVPQAKILEYVNLINEKITPEYCQKIEDTGIVGEFKPEVLEAFYINKCYIAYLANAIYNDKMTLRNYDNKIFSEDIIKSLYNLDVGLFFKYRLNLLRQTSEVKQTYKFMYSADFPFISDDEIRLMTCSDCLNLVDLDTVDKNLDDYIKLIKTVIKSAEDVFAVAKEILEFSDEWALDVFKQLPFVEFDYYKLSNDNKTNVLELYEKIETLETDSAIIAYMKLTGDLLETLEIRLLDIIRADGIDNADWEKYIALLNKINRFNRTTIDVIKSYSYEDALPPAVTNKLLELGEIKGYIIGKTLYNKRFDFETIFSLKDYIDIYAEQKEISKYMVQNNDFLVAVYQSKMFGSLSKEQLLVFNSWDQPIELITTVLGKCDNIDDKKNYILKIQKLVTLVDSDALQRLICNGNYDDLLMDDEVTGHIKYLLWDEHPGIKGAFTRYVNKLNKKIA